MKSAKLILLATLFLSGSAFLVSCETIKDDTPRPEREKISSMPHNIPQAWEGQAGMPGALGAQY